MDLPDVDNRMKILKIFLAQENLDPNFQYDELANVTEGYSGSDLKVCTLILLDLIFSCSVLRPFFLTQSSCVFHRTFALLQHTDLSKNFWKKRIRYLIDRSKHQS